MALSRNEISRRYRLRHPGKQAAACAKWRSKNHDKVLADSRELYRVRNEIIDAYKLSKGCARCGYCEYACALEFDHLPGVQKRREVSMMKQWSIEAIWSEIEKCQVLCANCHVVETEKRRLASAESKQSKQGEQQLNLRLA